MADAEVLSNLLKQTRRNITEILGDGAYDTKDCYEAIRRKQTDALFLHETEPHSGNKLIPEILVWPVRSCMALISTGSNGMITTSVLSQKRLWIGEATARRKIKPEKLQLRLMRLTP